MNVKLDSAIFLILAAFIFVINKFQPGRIDKLNLVIILHLPLISANHFAFDYFNIMVEYNTWFGRGMPAKPF